jgi:hypothetical protein
MRAARLVHHKLSGNRLIEQRSSRFKTPTFGVGDAVRVRDSDHIQHNLSRETRGRKPPLADKFLKEDNYGKVDSSTA